MSDLLQQESQDAFHQMVGALCQELGLEGMEADGLNCFNFVVDEDTVFSIQLVGWKQSLRFFADIGTVPKTAYAKVMPELLEANLFFNGTLGTTLGMDATSGMVILAQDIPLAALNAESLREATRFFLTVNQDWKRELVDLIASNSEETVTPDQTALSRMA